MRFPAVLTVFAVLLAPASATASDPAPLALALEAPEILPVGANATLTLDLHRPPGSPPIPDRVLVRYASDDAGTIHGPTEATLGPLDRCPGREDAPCVRLTVDYTPKRAGQREIHVNAEGVFGAASASFPLSVARDPVRFDPGVVGSAPEAAPGGARPVTWRVSTTRLDAAEVNLTLAATWHAEGFPHVHWNESAGTVRIGHSGVDVVRAFAPRWAAGNYTLALLAAGADAEGRATPVTFVHAPAPPPARSAAPVVADVEDARGTIALTSDGVNADGKLKAPGDALVTRASVSDPNGLADLGAILVRVDRLSPTRVTIAEERLPLDPAGTKASVEHRFALAPLIEGAYAVNLSAERGHASTAERTFIITNAKPTLAHHAIDPSRAFPAQPVELSGNVTLADRNFGSGPLDPEPATAFRFLSVKLYRGSTLVTDPAWSLVVGDAPATQGRAVLDLTRATRNGPWPTETVDGAGRLAIPFKLVVPAQATAGEHHLSVYHASTAAENPTLLGSVSFTIEPLPAVKTLAVSPTLVVPGTSFTVAGTVDPGARVDGVRLTWRGPDGLLALSRDLPIENGAFGATLTAPSPLAAGLVTALTAEPLPAGAAKTASIKVGNAPPVLAFAARADDVAWGSGPVRVLPGAARTVEVALAARDPNDAEPAVTFGATLHDWAGAVVPKAARVDETTNGTALARVALPADLAAGRYVLRLSARDAPGAETTAEVAIEVGAWLAAGFPSGRLVLAPVARGLEGSAPLGLAGNVRIGTVHVLLAPLASETATLAPAGVVASLVAADGRVLAAATVAPNATSARLAGLDLAPGDAAMLRLAWPLDEGTRAGRYDGYVSVAVEARA